MLTQQAIHDFFEQSDYDIRKAEMAVGSIRNVQQML